MKHLALIVHLDDGSVRSYLGIDYEEKIWLVTAWVVDSATGLATPERMIRVDLLVPQIQKCEPEDPFDYANIQLPRSVIEGVSQDAPPFEVRSLPDLPVVDSRDLKPLPSIFS